MDDKPRNPEDDLLSSLEKIYASGDVVRCGMCRGINGKHHDWCATKKLCEHMERVLKPTGR